MRQFIIIGMVGKYVNTGSYNNDNNIQFATFSLYPMKIKDECYKVIINGNNLKHTRKLLPGTIIYLSGKPQCKNNKIEVVADYLYFIKEAEIETE